MSNEEIVCLLQAESDSRDELLTQLWDQNQGLVCQIARRYSGKAEWDDLMQEAFIGLMHAAELWEPDKDALFASYMGLWIRQRLSRYLENDSLMPSYMYQLVNRYRKTVSEFVREQGYEPSETEICSLLGISAERLASVQSAVHKSEMTSLDAPIETEEGSVSLGELVSSKENPEEAVLNDVERAELQAVLWPMVDELPGDEPAVIRKKYQQGEALKQMSEETGRTVSQIQTTERKALAELRKPSRARKLRPFWDDDEIRSRSMKGTGVGQFRRTWTSSTEGTALKLVGD